MDPRDKEIIMAQLSVYENHFKLVQNEFVDYIRTIYKVAKDEDIISKSIIVLSMFRKSQ